MFIDSQRWPFCTSDLHVHWLLLASRQPVWPAKAWAQWARRQREAAFPIATLLFPSVLIGFNYFQRLELNGENSRSWLWNVCLIRVVLCLGCPPSRLGTYRYTKEHFVLSKAPAKKNHKCFQTCLPASTSNHVLRNTDQAQRIAKQSFYSDLFVASRAWYEFLPLLEQLTDLPVFSDTEVNKIC